MSGVSVTVTYVSMLLNTCVTDVVLGGTTVLLRESKRLKPSSFSAYEFRAELDVYGTGIEL